MDSLSISSAYYGSCFPSASRTLQAMAIAALTMGSHVQQRSLCQVEDAWWAMHCTRQRSVLQDS
eukprot:3148780-Amphidinium_carterae.2